MAKVLTQAAAVPEPQIAANRGKRIGILVVTYNALTTLDKVLQRIPQDVWENVEEVAIFDDASQDATYELAMGLKSLRSWPKLQVLKHRENLGYGGNQKAGYRYFMDKGFDIAILLHGDGQYAPEILATMYQPIVTGEADAVFGSRMMRTYGGPIRGGMPLYKYAGNRILTVFENTTLGMSLTEFHSGYRAYNLHALRQLDFTHMTDDFHFDTEIIIKLNHQRFRIMEVPIPTYYGTELCYVNGLKYAGDVVRAVYRYRQTLYGSRSFPEFREYFIHYPLKESRYSSHAYAQHLAGSDHDVLDLGCGEGFLAKQLAARGNRIVGVDRHAAIAEERRMVRYIRADLDEGLRPVLEQLGGKRFSRVLLLDVLEHLKRPDRLLRECHLALAAGGEIIVSLPNIANLYVRWKLLFGSFEYTDRGIIDKNHLRFYTRAAARKLLEENGFEIIEQKDSVVPMELVMGLPAETRIARACNRVLAWMTRLMPGLFGYQSVFVARSAEKRPG